MDLAAARALLEVTDVATPDEVRASFRRLVRATHPDHAGAGGAGPTAELLDAYRLLRDRQRAVATSVPAPPSAPSPPPPAAPTEGPPAGPRVFRVVRRNQDGLDPAVWAEADTVVIDAPAGETYQLLVEAGHRIGAVSHLDRSGALLEVIVTFIDHPVCSVVLSLQGRGNGTTEAFCTVEALSGEPAPPADAVAALIAAEVQGLVART